MSLAYLSPVAVALILGWNELLIASFSHHSLGVKEGILLANGLHVNRANAHPIGLGAIYDRVLTGKSSPHPCWFRSVSERFRSFFRSLESSQGFAAVAGLNLWLSLSRDVS